MNNASPNTARKIYADDFSWEPNEAERKLLEARRERSDKISKIMGDYLLKGYKMLATTCSECSTILLEDKGGKEYCIACRELDTDTEKDNPVTNHLAARSLVEEASSGASSNTKSSVPFSRLNLYTASARDVPPQLTTAYNSDRELTPPSHGLSQAIHSEAVNILCDKILWACEELKTSTNVDQCIGLCNLIKASTDALQSIKVYSQQK